MRAKMMWKMMLFGAVLMVGAGAAVDGNASNYPPDYCHQIVRVLHDGPGLFAHVGSGCDAMEVIGYKKSGPLADLNPESIDAIVVGSCEQNGQTISRTSVVRLGREWHGTGFMSEAQSFYNFMPRDCWGQMNTVKIEVAFSAQGQWDSQNGANYGHFTYGFYSDTRFIEVFKTNEPGYGQVNLKAWDFIVGEMRMSRSLLTR